MVRIPPSPPNTPPACRLSRRSGQPTFLHIERCRRARPYRLNPGRQRLSSGRRPPPQTRWSQLGEALQVPRPARDIHEAVARTPPVASRPCAPAAGGRAADGGVRPGSRGRPAHTLTVIVRDSQATAVNDAKSAARRQATRVVGCIWRLAARTQGGVSVVFWREIHAFADANGNRAMRNRRRRLLGLRAVPAVAGHGYCAPRRAFLRAKGSPPSSRAAPGATSMTRAMLMKLMSRCRPTAPRENAYSMSAPTSRVRETRDTRGTSGCYRRSGRACGHPPWQG